MILFMLLFLTSFSASAQLPDLMGGLAIDSMITTQSVKGYNSVNLQLKKNNISQILQTKVIENQALNLNRKQNVSRETFNVNGYPAFLQSEQNYNMSITLKQVEKSLCSSFGNNFAGSQKIEINGKNSDIRNCTDKNTVKFYY